MSDEGIVLALLAAGAEVNSKGARGKTPLHMAVISGSAAVTAALLANGADQRIKDEQGADAARWAVHEGNAKVLDLLLASAGIGTDSISESKKTAAASLANSIIAELNDALEKVSSLQASVRGQGNSVDRSVFAKRRHYATVNALERLQKASALDPTNDSMRKLRSELTSMAEESVNVLKLNYPSLLNEMGDWTKSVLANER